MRTLSNRRLTRQAREAPAAVAGGAGVALAAPFPS